MHISEGVLSAPVLVTGAALTVAGTGLGLKKLDFDKIPQAAMLAAGFFVASLIHIPLGPTSVHLILNGIVGLLLGWAAFPVILVALILQAVFFQFGGITTLGVNTFIMATPAVAVHYLCRPFLWRTPIQAALAAFGCGFTAVLLATLAAAATLIFTEESFFKLALFFAASHLPVMIIEGLITLFLVTFLKKVQPSMLPGYGGARF